MPRWQAELTEAGYPPAELAAAVEQAGRAYRRPGPEILDGTGRTSCSAPGGRLASEKTFTRGT